MAGFSIIIPTHNRAELLREALISIQSLSIPSGWDAEVLVVDNNSQDHTAEDLAKSMRQGPLPVRHAREFVQGISNARNLGLDESKFDHLVYLDEDMIIPSDWLQHCVRAFAALSPDVVVGPVLPNYEAPPAPWMTSRMIESVTSPYSRKGDRLILLAPECAHEIPGCNFYVNRQVAVSMGGFNTLLGRSGSQMLGGEDWEFGERLVRAGKRVAYAPGCVVSHWISLHKMSRHGLRQRWRAMGATSRILIKLRNEDVSSWKQLYTAGRLIRFAGRAVNARLAGASQEAFQCQLEALRLFGFLSVRGRMSREIQRHSGREPAAEPAE